jgi:hypothetical protein
MLFAATACRFPEHPKRAAMDAAKSFVLRSVFDLQSRVPLTQNSVRPALRATGGRARRVVLVARVEDRQSCLSLVRQTRLSLLHPL